MRPNFNLMRATLTGALGGLLFGFDTVVISGAIGALVHLYSLTPKQEGFTVDGNEWWHFDYKDWPHYPILNLTFEQLESSAAQE